MKKIYYLLILFMISVISPMIVSANNYGIENFYMHVTVLENGDLYVREAFMMNGSYNGMDRDINFKNSSAPLFTGDKESLKGSNIYNGSSIELIQIRSFPFSNSISWNEIVESGTKFKESKYGNKGDFGIYTVSKNLNGVNYRIFNPSSRKNGFYLEYTIKDMAISHKDVAEIGWNIFNSSFRESIHHLSVDIYLPSENDFLRAWAHGPLTGNIKLIGTNHIKITIDDLPAYTAIDTRLVFNNNIITTTKTSDINAFDTIVEIETELADIANTEREAAKKQLEEEAKRRKEKLILYGSIGGLWFLGLIILVVKVYKKHDKEYASNFKNEYYRDFPANYNPSTVGYLIRQNINTNDLSACLLNLIYKKVITFEKINKKDYKLTYHENTDVMTDADKKLIKLIFREPEITLSQLKKKARSGYNSFINDFTNWKESAIFEAQKEEFFEQAIGVKVNSSIYSIIGITISIFIFEYSLIIGCILFLAGLVSLFYFICFSKRTTKGNEHYLKWKALKKFMKDFGRMDKKELPEIVLWEKYLVYAVSLGCADTLAKTMQLRIAEFSDMDTFNNYYDFTVARDMLVLNDVVSSSINSAVNNAYSAQAIANSSSSSGGGYGGGFSGGGGSFGGGSGGGRF